MGTLIMQFLLASTEPTITFEKNNIYDETIVVVADKDFEPYSFFDENGEPTGHDVEMMYLLADALEVNVEIHLTQWSEAIQSAKNNEVDFLLGLVYTPDELEHFQLSIPIWNDTFLAFGRADYLGLNDLYDKKIATLNSSDITKNFLEPYKLEQNTTVYDTYGEAFDSVNQGINDYVLATYSVGRRFSADYPTIKPYGSALVSNSFCIASGSTSPELMNRLNEVIVEKKGDGSLDALSQKWLGEYIEVISVGNFMKQHMVLFVLLLGILILTPLLSLLYAYKQRFAVLKNNEAQLLDRASRDSMTSLFNRGAAESLVNQIIWDTQGKSQPVLWMLDVDDFKAVNDTYGHVFGDQLLIAIAEDLKYSFGDDDILIRMGGDEFSVFMKNVKNTSALERKAKNICAFLHRTRTIQDITLTTSVSIGLAIFQKDGKDFSTLYNDADKALYLAKQMGKNKFYIYQHETSNTEQSTSYDS